MDVVCMSLEVELVLAKSKESGKTLGEELFSEFCEKLD